MIKSIQVFFATYIRPREEKEADREAALRLATAALLMEVARADHDVSAAERQVIDRLVREHFSVSEEIASTVSALAERHAQESTSLYPFTRLINAEYDLQDRIRLVRMLWQVAFSDGNKDKHEEHLVRKVAELLHVPHREFVRMRLETEPA